MERIMIGSVEKSATQAGRPVIHLYSTDTRLQFPVLTLFDASALESVGVDANDLTPGEPLHKRFWAYWSESEKLNQQGNPYRDIEYLEPLDTPATTTSVDSSALLGELRAMRAVLDAIAARLQVSPEADDHPDPDPALLTYTNGATVGDNPREQQVFLDYLKAQRETPPDRDHLRAWLVASES